jgi:hypothetical protein
MELMHGITLLMLMGRYIIEQVVRQCACNYSRDDWTVVVRRETALAGVML